MSGSAVPVAPSRDGGGQFVTPDQLLDWVNVAIDDSGLSLKEIAYALDLSPSQVSRLRNGGKPWTATKLARLPEVVQRLFLQLWSEALGVPADLAAALRHMADAYDPLPKRASRLAKANLSRAGPAQLQTNERPVREHGPELKRRTKCARHSLARYHRCTK